MRIILFLIVSLILIACGSKVSDKANEICDCVEENQNVKSDAMATMEALDNCTKNRNEMAKDLTSEEKSEFSILINQCLKDACEGKGMNYEVGVQ